MLKRVAVVLVGVLMLGACTGGGDVSPTGGPSLSTATTDATAPPTVEPPAQHEDVRGLAVRGRNGRLSWQPFEGASSYSVVVSSEDGSDVWTWTGTETAVVFGTPPTDDALDLPGVAEPSRRPQRGVSYHWTVIALDADDAAIASERGEPFTCAPRCGASGS